jgi:hypothetical protein
LINEQPFAVAEPVTGDERGGKILRGHLPGSRFAALFQQHATFGVEACGKQWKLTPAQMPDMIKFLQLVGQVERDVRQGQQQGLPTAAPSAAPSPQPPSGVPAAPAPAGAAPAGAPAPTLAPPSTAPGATPTP